MLVFIGGIVGPVAGLLTYEDGQAMEAKIDDLNLAQANLSHMVGRQTHVIRSQLEDLHRITEVYERRQQQLQNELNILLTHVSGISAVLTNLAYSYALTNLPHAVENGLDEYFRSGDRMIEVVQKARKGELHPALLTSEQLEPVYRDIQDHAPKVAFPIPGQHVSIEELAKIAVVTINCKNDTLYVVLDIPLIDKVEYTSYEMHPLPV